MLEILKDYGKAQLNPKEVARVLGKLILWMRRSNLFIWFVFNYSSILILCEIFFSP